MVPAGPAFEIVPGVGLGPIRFGATVATVERLMEAPCEEKTNTICRYYGRGAEFVLKNGVVVEMRTFRQERPSASGKIYGPFNGRLRNGVRFFMLPEAVREVLGPPKAIDKPKDRGPANTVEVHLYDGLRIEYDQLKNGNLAVGAIIVTKP